MNTAPFTNPCPAIFSPLTPALALQIASDFFCLQADFALARHSPSSITIVLTDSHLVLCQTTPLLPLYAVELQFALKFELIHDLDGLKSHAVAVQSPVTGVRFIVESVSVEFYFACLGLTSLWEKYLSKYLNQVGFHRLYKPLRKLGKGASATVYEVERITDGHKFAVKVFSKANTLHSPNPIHRETLLNQIELLRVWDSPHLMKLEGVFESDNSLYLVMQLLSNGQLHTRINQKQANFSMLEIKQFMHGLACGLKEMHQLKVMHRDIKPQNIMLRGSTGLQPVIADFGLAADVDSEDYLYYRCGTPGYVAPEITTLKKGQKVTTECDIFSAGVILHFLLLKRPLFEGKNCDEVYNNNRKMKFDLDAPIYKQVDPVGMDLLRKMLVVDPTQRIKASEILAHPFLTEFHQEKEVLSPASTRYSCDVTFSEVEFYF